MILRWMVYIIMQIIIDTSSGTVIDRILAILRDEDDGRVLVTINPSLGDEAESAGDDVAPVKLSPELMGDVPQLSAAQIMMMEIGGATREEAVQAAALFWNHPPL